MTRVDITGEFRSTNRVVRGRGDKVPGMMRRAYENRVLVGTFFGLRRLSEGLLGHAKAGTPVYTGNLRSRTVSTFSIGGGEGNLVSKMRQQGGRFMWHILADTHYARYVNAVPSRRNPWRKDYLMKSARRSFRSVFASARREVGNHL